MGNVVDSLYHSRNEHNEKSAKENTAGEKTKNLTQRRKGKTNSQNSRKKAQEAQKTDSTKERLSFTGPTILIRIFIAFAPSIIVPFLRLLSLFAAIPILFSLCAFASLREIFLSHKTRRFFQRDQQCLMRLCEIGLLSESGSIHPACRSSQIAKRLFAIQQRFLQSPFQKLAFAGKTLFRRRRDDHTRRL
jgi:hypothetical protein